jgi:DNA-binding transcriptional MerR regulator
MVASAEGGTHVPVRQRAGARPPKSAAAFRTISEVATELDVAQHVLRFWESKFPQVRPLKRGGGRRYYRPEDIELLRQIRSLLYKEGYTIKGAQKLLKGQKRPGAEDHEVDEAEPELALERRPEPAVAALDAAPPPPLAPEVRNRLRQLREELRALRAALADAAD